MPQELVWTSEQQSLTCTVCEESGVGTVIAKVSSSPDKTIDAIRCAHCGSVYLLDDPLDFSGTRDRIDSYVEIGVGLDAILGGISLANFPEVRTFLDVGCNVGFGMDMGKFLFGWDVMGVEPSSAGRFGAKEFGLTILNEYLTAQTELPHVFDAIFASEVLEHVPAPLPFLMAIRAHLAPDGIIVLTTPAAEIISPTQPLAASLAAISAGYHCFVASRVGLEELLGRAGFVDVRVSQDGGTLRASARAHTTPSLLIPEAPLPTEPELFERYLRHRAKNAAPGSALECGMFTRLLTSLVARGAFDEARSILPAFHRSFKRRHKVDLSGPTSLDSRSKKHQSAAPYMAAPCYSLAMYELLFTRDFAKAIAYFTVAERTLETLGEAAGSVGIAAADFLALIPFHRALAQAHTEPSLAVPALTDDALTTTQQCRVFVELIAAGFFEIPADAVIHVAAAARDMVARDTGASAEAGQDALFQLGILAANVNDVDGARMWFRECVRATEDLASASNSPPISPPAPATSVRAAALAQLAQLPAPLPHSMIDTYWRDAWGVYVDGWIHLEDVPILAVRVEFDGVTAEATRHPRGDLATHWPTFPETVNGGFRAYVAGGHGKEMMVILTTETDVVTTKITLPDHPLPAQPEPTNGSEFWDLLGKRIAQAPPGPVLAIGMRSVSEAQAVERLAIFGNREVVRVDIHPGFGVDVVGDAHALSTFLPLGHFAVVYSTSVLEHLTRPWVMALECSRVLVEGGLALHRAPWTWPTHSEPNDFYRFSPGGLAELFSPQFGFAVVESGEVDGVVVIPAPSWRDRNERMPTLTSASFSWIVARKIAEPNPDKLWDYSVDDGGESARQYPLEGLVGEQK